MMGVQPLMLTAAQVAESLAVSERTVARLCAKGDLPAYRVGRQWRIDRQDFLRWLREGKSGKWRRFTSVEGRGGSASNGAAKKSGDQLEQLLRAKPASISKTCKHSTAD